MKKLSVGLLATLAACALIGCISQKAPAEQAVASAETSLGAIRDTAQKYAPDQLQAVEAQLTAMKENLSKGDYPAVLAAAQNVNASIKALEDAADNKKAEADAALAKAKDQWGPMSTDVPKMVDAIQTRVDTLSKTAPPAQGRHQGHDGLGQVGTGFNEVVVGRRLERSRDAATSPPPSARVRR